LILALQGKSQFGIYVFCAQVAHRHANLRQRKQKVYTAFPANRAASPEESLPNS